MARKQTERRPIKSKIKRANARGAVRRKYLSAHLFLGRHRGSLGAIGETPCLSALSFFRRLKPLRGRYLRPPAEVPNSSRYDP
jgi:hypothetical protein